MRSFIQLPESHRGYRFVATFSSFFLACSPTNCAVFERETTCYNTTCAVFDPETQSPTLLRLLPGGNVPNGQMVQDIVRAGYQLCVGAGGPSAWCFDRRTWTCVPASLLESSGSPLIDDIDVGVAACRLPGESTDTLVRWSIDGYTKRMLGVTADGRVVAVENSATLRCCCELALQQVYLDVMIYYGGIARNSGYLTSEALYGTNYFFID